MNILFLAAGEHAVEHAQSYPVWLSEVEGMPLLERQVRSFAGLDNPRFVFVFRKVDVEAYFLSDIVEQMVPGSTVLAMRRSTAGAACTALLASGAIDMDDELIVASATDQIDVDFVQIVEDFHLRGADAGVLTFPSLHPRNSYVRLGADGWVVETAEKRPISRSASTGFYWFARASDFFDGVREMILKDDHVHERFYICPSLNQLILKQKKIAALGLATGQYHPLKSDSEAGALRESYSEYGAAR